MNPDPAQAPQDAFRGSLAKSGGIGLIALLGGHAAMWSVLPSLHPLPAFLAFLTAPWIALLTLAAHFLRRRESRTAWGLGIAAAILVGIALLLLGLVVLIFSPGGRH